jgi:NhaP-type Na+/H+ or K+/H+ antiporter
MAGEEDQRSVGIEVGTPATFRAATGLPLIVDKPNWLVGLLAGAVLGFLIGWTLQRYDEKRKHRSS